MPDLRDTVAISSPEGPGVPVASAPRPVRTTRGWVLIGAPVLAFILMSGIFAGLFAVLLHAPNTPLKSYEVTALYARAMQYNATHQALLILQDLLIVFSIWLLLPKRGPAGFASYFPRVSRLTLVLAALSGALLVVAVVYGLAELATHRLVSFHASKIEQELAPSNLFDLVPALLVGAIVAPIAEELYFRGLLLRWLRSRFSLTTSVLVSAALFALLHLKFADHVGLEGWVLTGGIFTVGILAAAWSIGARSLWPSAVAHGTYNAIAISLPFMAYYLGR